MIVKPFRGLRPIPQKASEIASLPYDVLSSDEARERVRNNANSFLHVIKPEVDLDKTVDVHNSAVYQKGFENLQRLIAENLMQRDEKPCYYIYQLQMGDHVQIGIAAATAVDDYENKLIKEHESTRPDKEQDRVNHIDITGAHCGPVFLFYKDHDALHALIEQAMQTKPIYHFKADYEVQHTFYVVNDDALIAHIEQEFGKVPALYVADGHHRSAAAARVRAKRRAANPNHTGDEAYNFFLSIIFPESQMRILEYNRAVTGLNGFSEARFLENLAEKFDISLFSDRNGHTGPAFQPENPHQFGMYLREKWYQLQARTESFDRADVIETLDVSILQNNLLAPLLKIGDPRTDQRIRFIGGIRGTTELEHVVDKGDFDVAFSMHATSIQQLIAVADAGLMMPPKSTWFEPKLLSGLVVHLLD